jgi:hypothetical protein
MFVGPVLNPPSTATSRTLIPSRPSSATVPGSSVSSFRVTYLDGSEEIVTAGEA